MRLKIPVERNIAFPIAFGVLPRERKLLQAVNMGVNTAKKCGLMASLIRFHRSKLDCGFLVEKDAIAQPQSVMIWAGNVVD